MIGSILSAIVGVLAFAILFHAPRRSYAVCALGGGLSWGIYLLMDGLGAPVFLSATVSVLVLSIMARVFSVAMELPGTIFIVPGIFPIVPGAGIYYTVYGLMTSDMELFRKSGMDTMSLAGGIAIGILLGMAVPDVLTRVCGRAISRILPRHMRRKEPISPCIRRENVS